jgi:hypothetical protein
MKALRQLQQSPCYPRAGLAIAELTFLLLGIDTTIVNLLCPRCSLPSRSASPRSFGS